MVGAPKNKSNDKKTRGGHARVYMYNQAYRQWIKMGNDIDGTEVADEAGSAVAISPSGRSIVVGAKFYDGEPG